MGAPYPVPELRFTPHVMRLPRVALPIAAVATAIALSSCSGTAGNTPPPSGACVTADASNTVALSAKDLKFSAPCIEATAGVPIVIKFTNNDSQPHNVSVFHDATKAEELVRGDIITGPNASTTVTVPAQPAGQYFFECTVHTSMNGALVVTATPGASPS